MLRHLLACLAAFAALTAVSDVYAQKKRGLVGALLGAGSTAASATRSGSAPVKTYGADDLRPDALKQCLITAHDIDEAGEKLTAASDRLDQESSALDKERAAIQENAKKEMTDDAEVDRHNARVRRYQDKVKAFNATIGQYEQERVSNNAKVATFNNDCAGKKYFSSDLASIAGELPFDPAKYSDKK